MTPANGWPSVMDELRRNKGWSVILRGHDLRLRDAPRDIVNERTQAADSRSVSRFSSEVAPARSQRPTFRCASAAITRFSIRRFRPTAIVNLAKQHGLSGRRPDRHRQFAWRGGIRAGGEARGHQTDFRNGIARWTNIRCCSTSNPRAAITILNRLLSRNAEAGRRRSEEGAVATQQRRPITTGTSERFHRRIDCRQCRPAAWPNCFPAGSIRWRRSNRQRAVFRSWRVRRFITPLPDDRHEISTSCNPSAR